MGVGLSQHLLSAEMRIPKGKNRQHTTTILISTHLHVSTAPSILLAPQSVMREPGWQAIGQGEKRWPSYRPNCQQGILSKVIPENSTLLQAS